MSAIMRWTIYDRGPKASYDWALRPGFEPHGMDPTTRFSGIEVVPTDQLEALRAEVDALRDHILSRAMNTEDYAAFRSIPSYTRKPAFDEGRMYPNAESAHAHGGPWPNPGRLASDEDHDA